MKTIMARNPNDSFSFSRRYFNWRKKIEEGEDDDREEILTFHSELPDRRLPELDLAVPRPPKPNRRTAVSKIRSALTFGGKRRTGEVSSGLGTRVVGTLFGHRRGHVLFAFQEDPRTGPAFLVELAMPTSGLVREMASGMVRVALECERRTGKKPGKILDEPVWRTYCNGRKCGFAVRRECGPDEWKVLNSIGPISMGAGVLPAKDSDGVKPDGGELMYMRAKFERVVGSKDSEAFYMMNPDGHGGPELSFYLLRV
ncbi:protein MIZU-KUSSEI 1-like [Ipomoea triloba]|uniref:protein MIZU-KUSSEI 1-like n=1 Tax=Ipomoea triloba TaxID=35885 RepID=UPI00125E43B9|nr:protein MIZU-KUSSEI 1-like [Ipomoea triloba]